MRISAQLKAAALAPTLMALIVGTGFYFSARARNALERQAATAHRINPLLGELNDLARYYVLRHEEGPKRQFILTHEQITALVAAARFEDPDQQRLLQKMTGQVAAVKSVFLKLVENHEQHGAAEDAPLPQQADERLIGQLMIRARDAQTDANRLAGLLDESMRAAQRRIYTLTAILLAITAAAFALILVGLTRRIADSLAKLRQGAEIIGRGNLAHRVGSASGDELGQLSRAFDQMSAQLQSTNVSRDDLLAEIERRKRSEQALRDSETRYRELSATLEQRVADRTAEVRGQAEMLRALAAELAHAEQRERKRLGKILHDHIQQLLVAAKMQLEWARREPDASRAAHLTNIETIVKEAISASRALTIEISPPILHEVGLIGALNWLISRMEERNRFKVHFVADSAAEPRAEEIRFLLFDAARELLLNAMKHSGVMEAEVSLQRADGNLARLAIKDRGRGFTPRTPGKQFSGQSIFGLFYIQQRLTHHGGAMRLIAAPGKGVEVIILAPLGANKPAETPPIAPFPTPPTSQEPPAARRARITVMLVENHKIMREGLVQLMRLESDIELVGEAENGAQAIELAETLHPDVVIMDVNLNGISGVEATRTILSGKTRPKIIGFSMHADQNSAAAMRAAGASAYIIKGDPGEELLAAIRACGRESSLP